MDNVLKQLLVQKQNGFIIKDITVVSDGSEDNTVKIAQKYINQGVKVIDGKLNRGVTYRQNQIISITTSDILVLVNGDIVLRKTSVIHNLILPIINGADFTAQWARPLRPRTFLERVLTAGFELKYYVYSRFKGGNNIYTCVGHMRALRKKFYLTITPPSISDGEDQYLYLACIKGGFKYQYVDIANLYFRLPDNFLCYKKYAKRIFQTQIMYSDIFGKEFTKGERQIPKILILRGCVYAFIFQHIYALLYIFLHFIMQKWSLTQPMNLSSAFEIVKSTKFTEDKTFGNQNYNI